LRLLDGIDHTLVAVRDLEAARRLWRGLGFTLTPRGRHIGWGTANYCIMFERGYVELIGVVDPTQFTNNLDAFLQTREGLMRLAFACRDGAAAAAGLTARGFHPEGPSDLRRILVLPEGDALPAFRLVHLPPGELPDCPAFICQHLTPELVRRPAWLRHPNGAEALLGVIVVAADPGEGVLAYAELFGDDSVSADAGEFRVETGGGALRFVTEARLQELYPGLGPAPALRPPYLAGMTIAVADTVRVAGELARQGGRLRQTPGGVALAYDVAGAILEFVPRDGGLAGQFGH
jgi:catechol 2,3-dioxygenase-like lactoylglutathione lyase family enzyme